MDCGSKRAVTRPHGTLCCGDFGRNCRIDPLRYFAERAGAALAIFSLALLAGTGVRSAGVDELAAPGELIPVGHHRLHLHCQGQGGPTVILDAGLGGSSLDWSRVQPAAAAVTRSCSYDRAGYGWSEPGPPPRTSAHIVAELHTLLRRAEEPAPYLLVGHSFGGYNVRLFASRHPTLVAGVILVDAAHEEQAARFRQRGIGHATTPGRGKFVIFSPPKVPDNLPQHVKPVALAMAETVRAVQAMHDELASFADSAAQLRGTVLPDLPMTVITRGQRVWPHTERGERMERLWVELQQDLAQRRPHTLHIVARGSGHYVQLDEPEVVVEAIATMVGAIRAKTQANGPEFTQCGDAAVHNKIAHGC